MIYQRLKELQKGDEERSSNKNARIILCILHETKRSSLGQFDTGEIRLRNVLVNVAIF